MPNKPRTGSDVECEICGVEFYAKKHIVDSPTAGRFCSLSCKSAWDGRNAIVRPCEWCGAEMKMSPFRATLQRFCSRSCFVEAKRKHTLEREHNGRRVTVTPTGYIMVWEPDHPGAYDGWILEHRLIMEKKVGRRLSTNETVHHLNGIKGDNDPENLLILSRAEHTKVTNQEQVARRKRDRAELAEYRKRFGALGSE